MYLSLKIQHSGVVCEDDPIYAPLSKKTPKMESLLENIHRHGVVGFQSRASDVLTADDWKSLLSLDMWGF